MIKNTRLKIALFAVVAACISPSYAGSFEQESYLGVSFGDVKGKERSRLAELFEGLKPGFQAQCLYDGRFYAALHVVNDIPKAISTLHSVSLSVTKPDIPCINFKGTLPSFSGFEPGMYSFELIAGLTEKEFYKYSADGHSANYKKDFFSTGRCYVQAANDYSQGYQYYGVNKKTIEYTLSGVSKSAVSKVEKRISNAHVEDSQRDCNNAGIASRR